MNQRKDLRDVTRRAREFGDNLAALERTFFDSTEII